MSQRDDDAGRLLYEAERRLAEQIRLNAELEEALRAMELRALQSQVNPHFLFNTLSSIAACSFMEQAPKTYDLVQALARLLRYTLRQIGQMVELDEELRHVQDYLLIEKTRFGERINVAYAITPAALRTRLPLLTIQPLVENAIIHGLEPKAGGTVTIAARVESGRAVIQVIDDGAGISAPGSPAAKTSHVTGLGLENVRRRLGHAFGEQGGLAVESRPGQGTTVTLTLPAVAEEAEE